MPTKSLRWSAISLEEYGDLVDYLLSEWGENITLRIITEIEQTAIRINNSPEQFPIFIKGKKVRRCVLSPQTSIYFKELKNEIVIISLFDNRRDPKKRRL